jgi:NAD(P)H-hydrate epimerase
MKIFSASQIRACDAYTIHASGITSIDLMERAATACVAWINANMPKDSLFIVLCGTGNNGGDGLAITRLLHKQGYGVKAFLMHFSEELTDDCRANLKRLQNMDNGLVEIMKPDTFITDVQPNIVIIDAIMGTGLNRPVEGWLATLIEQVSEWPNRKIAIDIPSGMPADSIPAGDAPVLEVNDTLSFQFYKRSFLHPETGRKTGNVHILDIGLHETFINSTHSNYNLADEYVARSIYRKRQPFTHKGDYGTAFIIGGSYGMMGAALLATKAAVRSGAGKVKALIPECGYSILQTAVPEAMSITKGEKFVTRICEWEQADAIGIGPGLGLRDETARTFASFIEACKKPIVVDADGLNLLAATPDLMYKLPPGSILTPHPKEFEKLFGSTVDSMFQLEHARTQAMKYNIFIVLKGRYTMVVTPEGESWYNLTGNPGMATGGSGDVLTGIITGMLAQGYSPYEAAILGVYLHGLAGDYAANRLSQEAIGAGDIIDSLGAAFREIATT